MTGGFFRTLGNGTAKISENRTAFLIRNVVIGFAGLLGLVLAVRFIFVRDYDYDELSHAHLAWLVSIGEVPYRDFAANHFPFLWILVSPLMRVLPQSPVALMVLRGLALLFNAVFLGILGTLICWEQPVKQRIWAVACFGIVIFSWPAIPYLIDFRPDPFANALLFSALAWLSRRGSRNVRSAFLGGFGIGAAVLINTKYALFPFVLGAVALAVHVREIRRLWPFALAICLGFSACLLGGLLLLVRMRVPLDAAWRMVVVYNATVERTRTLGFGLAHALTQNPGWTAYILAGLVGCVALFIHQRRSPGPFAVATLLFLVVNLVTTTRPWKQYLLSWLFLGAYFPAHSVPVLAARLGPKAQIAAALVVLATATAGFARTVLVYPIGGVVVRRAAQDRLIEWVVRRVPPDGFVVADLFLHPVFRRDTFFKTVADEMPGADAFEEFMRRSTPASQSEHFQKSGYEKELEIRPPSLMVLSGSFTRPQHQVLEVYQSRQSASYEAQQIPGTDITVAERKTGRLPAVQ